MIFLFVVGILSLRYQYVIAMAMLNKPTDFMNDDSDSIIANYINAKGYLPKDLELPKSTIVNNADNDITYLLSKLSDEELIKLLNEQPKKTEYNLNDILQINYNIKSNHKSTNEQKQNDNFNQYENRNLNKRFETVSGNNKPSGPIFRLENKEVNPYAQKNDADPKYVAIQKLHNLLYSRPQSQQLGDDVEGKKELLFDVLVAQLKALCCKRHKPRKNKDADASTSYRLKSILDDYVPRGTLQNNSPMYETSPASTGMPREYIFLIINDELKSNDNEDLIYVDPESLERNSSVLLLGPITNRMTDAELKLVMTRISNELSKPEYLPLFYQISDGRLNAENIKLNESLITGPDTRRYIKPHRCNDQSKLARIYGGPKWLICTGYLNLNAPSIYD